MSTTDYPPTVELLIPLRPQVRPVVRTETMLERIRTRALVIAVPFAAGCVYVWQVWP